MLKVEVGADRRPRQVSKERFEATDRGEQLTTLSAAAGRAEPEAEASGCQV